jgi:hypothetical protein
MQRKKIMGNQRLVGVVLLVVGIILLYFGWQASESLGDQITRTFTGRFTNDTMWYLIGGAAAAVAGVFLLLFRR